MRRSGFRRHNLGRFSASEFPRNIPAVPLRELRKYAPVSLALKERLDRRFGLGIILHGNELKFTAETIGRKYVQLTAFRIYRKVVDDGWRVVGIKQVVQRYGLYLDLSPLTANAGKMISLRKICNGAQFRVSFIRNDELDCFAGTRGFASMGDGGGAVGRR